MNEILYETIEAISPIIDEMGEERLVKYCKCYLELGFSKENFFYMFKEYLENNNKISINSFRNFLINNSLNEIMNNVIKYNE